MINECTEIEESQKYKSSTGLASSPASPPGPQGRSSVVAQGSKQMEGSRACWQSSGPVRLHRESTCRNSVKKGTVHMGTEQ